MGRRRRRRNRRITHKRKKRIHGQRILVRTGERRTKRGEVKKKDKK
jgi:hypothetical protein